MRCYGKLLKCVDHIDLLESYNEFGDISYIALNGNIEIHSSHSLENLEEKVDAGMMILAATNSPWVGPKNSSLNTIQKFIFYPISRALLLLITLGNYPKQGQPHNPYFVANFIFIALSIFIAVVTIIYS